MRALVTGINGFVGRYLEQELLNNGFEVFGILQEKPIKKTHFQGDILDKDFLIRTLLQIKPDVVFHLAGFTSVKSSWESADLAMKVNQGGTEILYSAIAEANSRAKVVITSSADVYGNPTHVPIQETDPTLPTSPYAKSKLAQEEVAKKHKDITIICRSFPHTGPAQTPTFVIPSFAMQIAAIEKKQQATLSVGNLEAKRDFLDVRDVVRAYRFLGESSLWGNTYNICSGVAYSIKEILDMLMSFSTIDITIVEDPSRLRPSDIPILLGDNTKITRSLPWSPEIPIEQTLKDTLAYWRKQTPFSTN